MTPDPSPETVRVNADALADLLRRVDPGGFQTNALGVAYTDDGTGVARTLTENPERTPS